MNPYRNIERYLQGDLKKKEIREFEHSLEKDSRLLREFKLRKEIEDALLEDDVMDLRTQMQGVMEQQTSNPVHWFKRKAMIATVVAGLLLGLGGTGYYFYLTKHAPTTDKIFQEYYQPYEATITIRSGAENEINGMLTNALEKYKQQDYRAALQLFEKVLYQRDDVAASLYSGISHMEIKEYREANESFDTVIEDKDNLFLHQAKWYMSMCHIKLDNQDKAITLLEELSQQSGYYKDKAKEVVRKLKRISED
jgi:tetratricopeptide (TPR) repeat protein